MICNPACPGSWAGPMACQICERGESMRRAAKVDINQREIVSALKRIGAEVQNLSRVGDGCPDLLVGFRGRNFLLEVKRPKAKGQREGTTTDAQDEFFSRWSGRGQAAIVKTVDDALRVLGCSGGRQ